MTFEEPLEIILYKNDGRLKDVEDFISFHGLEEIIVGFSYILLRNFEYEPIFNDIYESLQISVRYDKDREHTFRVRNSYIIYKREGYPEDNLILTVKEIQSLPLFVKNIDRKNIDIFFYLDDEAIFHTLKSNKYPVFDFIFYPISQVSLGYFSESDIKKLDIENVEFIYSYPVILKIKSLDEFLKLIKRSIIKSLEKPNYIT